MRNLAATAFQGAVLLVTAIVLTGCPKPDYELALIVTPKTLDFGTTQETLTFTVAKVASSRPLPAVSVAKNQAWISIDSISPPEATSDGPKDPITITVSVDRTLMAAGDNTGAVTVSAPGVVPVEVTIRATVLLSANFTAAPRSALIGDTVQFTDLSQAVAAEGPIQSWLWDFGDGETSSLQNPTHSYDQLGTFDISLTVETANLESTEVKTGFITVSEKILPVVDFTASQTLVPVGTPVRFTDQTQPGSVPISSRLWDFGDGETSTATNPIHAYADGGTFTVSLTVTAGQDQVTETKVDLITVTADPPEADFTAMPRRVMEGEEVNFIDLSVPGSGQLVSWFWQFGDGETSSLQNPIHQYAAAGQYASTRQYDISLTVTNSIGAEDTEVKPDFIEVFAQEQLDAFVREPEPRQDFTVETNIAGTGFIGHVLTLISQVWRDYDDFQDRIRWDHTLTIVEPDMVTTDTAMLVLSGGDADDPLPTSIDPALAATATGTGAVVAELRAVPNQPLTPVTKQAAQLREDALIAYTFGQYLEGGDADWPVLQPMAKSAVAAMDAIQEFMAQQGVIIDRFFITGGSKRGWTTWLTAATDGRVVGIAPLSFNALNLDDSMQRHTAVYGGGFSDALQDYVTYGVFDRLGTSRGDDLLAIVDPYEYRGRFGSIPTLMVNAAGDEFFLPESARFYFDDLPGANKYLRFVPNADHSLAQEATSVGSSTAAFFQAVKNSDNLPEFTWDLQESDAQGTLTVTTQATPTQVTLYTADSSDRTFRFDRGVMWQSQPLGETSPGVYSATVPAPGSGWTGFFIELEFDSGTPGFPHIFTTEVGVVPTTLP